MRYEDIRKIWFPLEIVQTYVKLKSSLVSQLTSQFYFLFFKLLTTWNISKQECFN